MKRIAFFAPARSQYGVLSHFTEKLSEAFLRQGVSCRTFTGEGESHQRLVAEVMQDAPDFTCAFNGLLPDNEGYFLSDHLQIPHLAWLVDSPQHFFPLAKSKFTAIGCDDSYNCPLFDELGAASTLFLPHAVEREAIVKHDNPRHYDLVFLGSLYDPDGIRREWQERYSSEYGLIVDQAAERLLSEEGIPCSQVLLEAFKDCETPCPSGDFIELLDLLERYVRGRDRCDLLRSIRSARVHIFGSAAVGQSWERAVGDVSNLRVHPSVPYTEALKVMRQARVVLNSCPRVRSGGHERICAGLASGALVLTQANPFLRNAFTEGRDIAFYQHSALGELDDLLGSYLSNEEARGALVEAGQSNIRAKHTFDVRAGEILEHMNSWQVSGKA